MQTQIHPPNMWPAQIVFILQAIYIYDICPFHYKAASTKTSIDIIMQIWEYWLIIHFVKFCNEESLAITKI